MLASGVFETIERFTTMFVMQQRLKLMCDLRRSKSHRVILGGLLPAPDIATVP